MSKSRETSPSDSLESLAGWECHGYVEGGLHTFDLNHNSRTDLTYGNWQYNSFVREASTDDSFPVVHEVSNPVGSDATYLLCAGDGDSDGRGEMVFGSGTSGVPRDLFIVESREAGLYPDSIVAIIPEVDIGVNHMRMADLDHDGRREYVGTTQGSHYRLVAIWEARGDNTYARVFAWHPAPPGGVSGELSVGDFDGDGAGDIVVVHTLLSGPPAYVHVYEAKGDDVYREVWSTPVDTYNMYWSTQGPDLDRDGRGDFVVVAGDGFGEAEWRFMMFESNGDDSYSLVWTHEVTGGWIDGGAATGDLDGDGWNELVCQVADKTQILRYAGDDSLEVVWEHAGPVFGQGEHRVIAPDLDWDGKGELIWWTRNNPGQAVVYERVGSVVGLPWVMAEHANIGCSPFLRTMPNPAAREVVIRCEIPPAEANRLLDLSVFNPAGRLIRRLRLVRISAGSVGSIWDCRDETGQVVPDGMYLLRVETAVGIATGRVSIVR